MKAGPYYSPMPNAYHMTPNIPNLYHLSIVIEIVMEIKWEADKMHTKIE